MNLFALPSYRSGGLSELGSTPEGWLAARDEIAGGLVGAAAVLLAYGTQTPSGPARDHFRHHVAWLDERISEYNLPTWWVGGAPRHPSRWQRYTWRECSGLEFREALRLTIVRRDIAADHPSVQGELGGPNQPRAVPVRNSGSSGWS